MAYFLKKTRNKKGLYLQIYESFYNPSKKHTSHRSIKPIGYVHELEKQFVGEDVIEHFQREVDELNLERTRLRESEKRKRIEEIKPEKSLGYFALEQIDRALKVDSSLNAFNLMHTHSFDVTQIFHDLVYARSIDPASKRHTFKEVLPTMDRPIDYSQKAVYEALDFLGANFEKVVETYTKAMVREGVGLNFSHTYFDCTNFYFEIDLEDEFRRKGPSKENRVEPLVALGILLDANQIPVGLEIFAGNESEKPHLRDLIEASRRKGQVQGKIIQVADKGLNCAENIASALQQGDGYLFSKSIRQLPKKELTWALNKKDMQLICGTKGKDALYAKEVVGEFEYSFDVGGKKVTHTLKEKRVVTFSEKLYRKKIHELDKELIKMAGMSARGYLRKLIGRKATLASLVSANITTGEVEEGVEAVVGIDETRVQREVDFAGYNLYVSSECQLSLREILEAYRGLWRIEESFRVLKSSLDLRPVYLQKESSIKGHVLICYIALLLLRLLQFRVLKGAYGSEEVLAFIKNFKLLPLDSGRYINLSPNSEVLKTLAETLKLPLDAFELTSKEKDAIFKRAIIKHIKA